MREPLNLPRDLLAKLASGNHQSIKALERVLKDVGTTLPDEIESAQAQAVAALVVAQQALGSLADLIAALDTAPAVVAPPADDQAEPSPQHLGTIAAQNHDSVDITGGKANLDAGTELLPTLTLGGDVGTGLWRVTDNTWAFSVDGVTLFELSEELLKLIGRLRLDLGTEALPALYLDADTGTGIYRPAADQIGVSVAGAQLINIAAGLFKVLGDIEATEGRFTTLDVSTWSGVVTGSRGGNAALASLLTVLAAQGIVTDSTTP